MAAERGEFKRAAALVGAAETMMAAQGEPLHLPPSVQEQHRRGVCRGAPPGARGGLRALPGPVGASQAHAAASQLAAVGYEPVTAAAAAGQVIVADCGRLAPGTPVTPLLDAAAVVLVVTTSDAAALAHVHARLGTLADTAGQVELLLSGRPGPYPAAEISDTLGVSAAGRLPWDPAGAALLRGVPVRRGWRTRWRSPSRPPLLAAAAETAWRISQALTLADVPSDPETRQAGADGSPPGEPVPDNGLEASAGRQGSPR